VGSDGHLSELEAFGGPEILHKPALDCVQKWLFTPAEYDGKPVATEIVVNVKFRMP
jgi:outer membrane biosynthesis protein TonB